VSVVVEEVVVGVEVVPKRAARARRLDSSVVRVVVGRLADREGLGVVVGGSVVVVDGGLVVRSEVLEGAMAGTWLGTAVGLAGGARPPAAIVAAEAGFVAAAASSSQSISSSVAGGAAAAAAAVGLEEEAAAAAWSVSCCWRRAIRSAFLPVWGRERDLRSSSSSAFFFLL